MSTDTPAANGFGAPRRWLPEALLAVLAGAVFLGCLGSVDLWGKREQRASAEAIDTLEHNHWLVAQIQGRPRLEKPPLLRWSIAALMVLTGRRDEWMVRLPGALSALATVALVYALGRRMGGRAVGLSSALVLCSSGFFVGEMRQASNDGPLVFFTTLALYAVWRRLHDRDDVSSAENQPGSRFARVWPTGGVSGLVLPLALGLGFLTKGPIILLLVGTSVMPYLIFSRRLTWGLGRLLGGRGLVIFAGLAPSWPVAVLVQDPSALRVWSLEMSEKTGLSHILEHRRHSLLAEQWPGMMLPWTFIALVAVLMPLLAQTMKPGRPRSGARGDRSHGSSFLWFAWWWAIGNLVVFCTWAVAKPNYYVPCLPGMALLIGAAWVQLTHAARGQGGAAVAARGVLQTQWVLLFVAAMVAPLVVRPWLPTLLWPWSLAIALAIATGVAVSVYAWRRGADLWTLAPVTAACAFGVLIAYGVIAPAENSQRSHRALAQSLQRLVPPTVRTLMFFNEIDEGLWFYSSGFDLAPVPGSHPRYNTAYDLAASYLTERLPFETIADVEARRLARDKQALLEWLDHNDPRSSYLLIRSHLYDRFASDLAGRVRPILRETGMKRNELILLQATGHRPPPATASTIAPNRR
jgi:4-amino-4-deoxy-L-arabinose transferase-like glycosyltransferase